MRKAPSSRAPIRRARDDEAAIVATRSRRMKVKVEAAASTRLNRTRLDDDDEAANVDRSSQAPPPPPPTTIIAVIDESNLELRLELELDDANETSSLNTTEEAAGGRVQRPKLEDISDDDRRILAFFGVDNDEAEIEDDAYGERKKLVLCRALNFACCSHICGRRRHCRPPFLL